MVWQTLAAELGLSAWLLVLLAADVALGPKRRDQLWGIAMLGLVAVAGLLWWERAWIGQTFGLLFSLDRLAWIFKWLSLAAAAVVVLMTRAAREQLAAHPAEFYVLLLTSLLGALVLASVSDLLLLFVGLELMTFSIYVMAAYVKQDKRSVEAGLKYLIMGSISSGFLVYGISLLYGFAGGTHFDTLRAALHLARATPAAQAGMLLVLAGLGFKVAAVPFHLWVPDVYEGAPTPVAAWLSIGSKMAGMVALLRLLYGVFLPVYPVWGTALALASAATMLYGNLGAIPQTNIKRLLGYSSIGHAGYLLMGAATGTASGAAAIAFYLLAYLVSNLAVFFVVIVASRALGSDSLDAYNGLSRRSPILAAVLFIGLLSLAGVPPLAGFVGKLFVLLAAVDNHLLWLAAIGAANVAVSLYYYLMVVRRVYVGAPASSAPIPIDGLTRSCLLALTVAIILIGVYQDPLVRWIGAAVNF